MNRKTRREVPDSICYSIQFVLPIYYYRVQASQTVLGFSANRVWLVTRFNVFFHIYVTPAFSISTINTIGLCVLSWPSCLKRWSVDLEVRAIQVRAPSEIFWFYFWRFPTNKIIFIFIRRELRIPDKSNYFYSSGTIPDEYKFFYSSRMIPDE